MSTGSADSFEPFPFYKGSSGTAIGTTPDRGKHLAPDSIKLYITIIAAR